MVSVYAGETLNTVVEGAGDMTLSWAYDVALQLLYTYQVMKSLGIQHNDLKSNNVCVTTTQDGSPLTTIIDFDMCTDENSKPLFSFSVPKD